MLTDVEISRALNALSVTLRDQRPPQFDARRAEEIVRGTTAQEPKITARATGAVSGELHGREDGRLLAQVELQDGQWTVVRKIRAGESSWALPRPAHDQHVRQQQEQGEEEQQQGDEEGQES